MERFKLKGGLPDVRGTALSFLASGNPFIKAPLEQLFNTQFHTGRKLSDLRPSGTASALGSLVGDDNPQLLSQIIANTPRMRPSSRPPPVRVPDRRKSCRKRHRHRPAGAP